MMRLFISGLFALISIASPAAASDINQLLSLLNGAAQAIQVNDNIKSVADVSGSPRVTDGDTLRFGGQSVRLHGIDAPESKQNCIDANGSAYACGQAAKMYLEQLIGGSEVVCEARDTDRYGRIIGVCHAQGRNLNETMAQAGWAVAYRRFSRDFVPAENYAKDNKLGMWSGTFDMPWDWRRSN